MCDESAAQRSLSHRAMAEVERTEVDGCEVEVRMRRVLVGK
jgi:hypothetical protein